MVDALSRCPSTDQLLAITEVVPHWLQDICATYDQDPTAMSLMTQLVVAGNSDPHFYLHNGVIKYDGKIWLDHNVPLQKKVFLALHASSLGGHSGAPTTFYKI